MNPSDVAVADAEPAAAALQPLPPVAALDAWEQAGRACAAVLGNEAPDAAWLGTFDAAAARLRELAARDLDVALYVLMHRGSAETDRYSVHHAMLCAVICEACAGAFGWDAERTQALVRAALSMNLSMAALQDTLARQAEPVSATQRASIDTHAERSAELLRAAGVSDEQWLDTVRQHHARDTSNEPARLLQRVDTYTAKLSRRASRVSVSPALAARDACLGSGGAPDAIGATILRCVGLYPPGCFVRLVNGDVGIVVRRGAKAHTPLVAALRRADQGLYGQPAPRDTSERAYMIEHGVAADTVKVLLRHERILAIRA